MTQYNIYFGTIGKKLHIRYQYTKNLFSEEEAKKLAYDEAKALYFKYEGKYGLPSYAQISEEHNITGISIEDLYEEHIKDMCRWYVIPTEKDTIPRKKIKW